MMSARPSRSTSATSDASRNHGSSNETVPLPEPTPPVTPAETRTRAKERVAKENEGSLDNVEGTPLSNVMEQTSDSNSASDDVSPANRQKNLGFTGGKGKPNQTQSLEATLKRTRSANSNQDAAVLVDNSKTTATRKRPKITSSSPKKVTTSSSKSTTTKQPMAKQPIAKPSTLPDFPKTKQQGRNKGAASSSSPSKNRQKNNQDKNEAIASSSSLSKNEQKKKTGKNKAIATSSSSTTTTRQTSSNPTTPVEPGTYDDLRQFGNYT